VICLENGHLAGEPGRIDGARITARSTIVLDRLKRWAFWRGEQDDVHAPSLPPARDIRGLQQF
jgi:hypothetical protein